MKRFAMSLSVIAALLAGASLARGQEGDAPKPKKEVKAPPKKPLLSRQYAEMAKVLGLSEDVQKQVAEVVADQNKAMKEFNEANGAKMKTLGEELKKAREAKDEAAMKKAGEEMKPLNEKKMDIAKKANAGIMALLSDEQKAAWEQHQTVKTVAMRYRKADLTEEQMAKVKAACAEATKGVDMNDAKAKGEALKKLNETIVKDVLTDEQREAIKPKPRPRSDKPAPKPKADE